MATINLKDVLSKPRDQRQDFEVRQAAEWLRNTVRHFKGVKDNIMWKLVQEGATETFEKDALIILEGDPGDVMYVLLSGHVTIYRKRELMDTADDRKDGRLAWKLDDQHLFPDRAIFGEVVACLDNPGIIFGEIALIEDAPRSASIVANAVTQLFAISRDLYSRTVSDFVAREFREKTDFINYTPLYQNWNPRFKKQIAMALNMDVYEYQSPIVKQGEPVKGIYYVLSGQVALSVVPMQHLAQFAPGMSQEEVERMLGNVNRNVEEQLGLERTPSPVRKLTPHEQRRERVRRTSNQNRPLEVSLLDGSNQNHRTSCFGDSEVVLGYDTYLCTATATERTVVLELNLRSFERLVVRRNPAALDTLRYDAAQRMQLWLERTSDKVPFFRYSLEKLRELQKNGKKGSRLRPSKSPNPPSVSPSRGLQLPPNGALVDQYGPGTVFSYIRQKDSERKARKAHISRTTRPVAESSEPSVEPASG